MLILNSFPKSGTNFLRVMIEQIGVNYGHLGMYHGATGQRHSYDLLKNALTTLPKDYAAFVTMHLHWRPEFAAILKASGWRMVLLLRDPRDVIVSHAHYIANTPEHHLHDLYVGNDLTKNIWRSLLGFESYEENFPDIGNRLLPYLGWLEYDFVLPVTYESLIADPVIVLKNILTFWGDRSLESIPKMIAAGEKGSPTFRKGQPGEWKESFTDEHKRFYNNNFLWIHEWIERKTDVTGWD